MKRKHIRAIDRLEEAKKKHSVNYQVLSNAAVSKDNLTIRCKKHGIFEQSKRQFGIAQFPCPACRSEARAVTTADYQRRAKARHGNRFDYSETIYTSGKIKVRVICNRHGPFYVLPHSHLRGAGGCIDCKTGRLTTPEFISRSKVLFPGRHDYSATQYTTSSDIITMECLQHGTFTQRANAHLQGKEGCPSCAREQKHPESSNPISRRSRSATFELKTRRLTQDEFVKRAKKAHGNHLDFSRAEYRTQYDKVTVVCLDHGPFGILPFNLWHGGGCPDCGKISAGLARRTTPKTFLKKARKIHGETYDLSSVRYVRARDYITPLCAKHGEFEVLPANFLSGTGCPVCATAKQVLMMNTSARLKDVSKLFRAIHGNRYDYSQLDYRRIDIAVTIICKRHGPFTQIPQHHLDGKGCPTCGAEQRASGQLLGRQEVISRFTNWHGERYDYSEFEYRDFKSKSVIFCKAPDHGQFQMSAQSHLEGKGCPLCANSKGEWAVERWLKKNKIEYERQFAIKIDDEKDDRFRLKFDFLLPAFATLIEFDGEQHFRPVCFYGMSTESAKRVFELTKMRDQMKADWAKRNGLRLVRIRHDEEVEVSLEYKMYLTEPVVPVPAAQIAAKYKRRR